MNIQWLAGFFDGEGCVYIGKGGEYMTVSITQKKTEPLYLIKNWIGGNVYNKGKGCSVWRTNDKRTSLKFLRAIRPYAIVKSNEINIGIEFAKTISNSSYGHQQVTNEAFRKRNALRVLIGNGKRRNVA